MIFEWSKASGGWQLLADTGELLGVAKPIPGDCWSATMTTLAGGLTAVATHLDLVQEWMMAEARSVTSETP
jgi:hypothetical protein